MSQGRQHHTLVALVQDQPGVLTRVASMFRRRGFNIASLAVGKSEQPGLSRMTFVVDSDEDTVSQVTKQLDKLIDVIQVSNITDEDMVARELALVKVIATPDSRGEIIQIANLFRANIVDVGTESMMIEVTGEENKLNAIHKLLQPFGIVEMLRTGVVAMARGQPDDKVNSNTGTDFSGNGLNVN